MTAQPGELLAFAEQLAGEAAREIVESSPAQESAWTKASEADWVTPVDHAVEDRIRTEISSRFPAHTVLGEERGESGTSEGTDITWHVDPIDGTTNFLHGVGNVSVSIAAVDVSGPVAAAVRDVYRRQTISAGRGLGVRIDGGPVEPRRANTLSGQLMLTEWSGHQPWPGMYRFLTWATSRAGTIRIIGSCALALAHAGLGRAAATILPGRYNSWDVAAGLLIATEGGQVVYDQSGPATGIPLDGVLVSGPELAPMVWHAWRDSTGQPA